MSRRSRQLLALLVVCGLTTSAARAAEPLELRWVYLQQNLQVAENLPKIEAILRRAAKSGYNGVVLADYKLNILDRVPDHYFKNAAKFRDLCRELKLEIVPTVAGFGYSSGILAHDPNLAEGLPARDVPFIVKAGKVVLDIDGKNLIPGDFENLKGDAFSGWGFQDEPGQGTFADSTVKHGGKTSLRIENAKGVEGNRRVSKPIKVRPWSQFHASVWIKTEDFESAGETKMFAMSPAGRVLSHSNLGVKKDQDWTQHHVVFNTLDSTEVRFYLGAWGCRGGKLWMDDATLIEEPFVNLVRRPGCPLVVKSNSTEPHGASRGFDNAPKTAKDDSSQTTFIEGRDFAELRDPKLGTSPWAGEFDVYHEPPTLTLLPGSQIKDGQKLRVSYYHAVTIYDNQVPCSLTEPKVFEIVEDQVRRVQKLFEPQTYFLSHDEIRVANWSEPDRASGKTAGQQLADNVRRCAEIVRRINPQAKLCIWSDMFDPHHNAVKDFYLVNGDLSGSWEGLPKDTIIMNWNSGKPAPSLKHFATQGHSQVLAGYYDAPPERIRNWLDTGKDVKGLHGAMYTTWQGNFTDLEKFATAAWGEAK
ncbi:MAG: family 20 glycosylhydrolase [Planctomycetales bacterium]|nr:family 20 glycosylhydrolase [Planctomycetales bacterium]